MGLDLTGLGSASEAVSNIAKASKDIVNTFFVNKTEIEKEKITLQIQSMMNEHNLVAGQIEVNKEEAKSTDWKIAGWRPYIGWVCGTGLLYQFIFMPISNGLIKTIMMLFDKQPIEVFVSLDISTLVTCLGGMLGLAGMRTYEKRTGAEANR